MHEMYLLEDEANVIEVMRTTGITGAMIGQALVDYINEMLKTPDIYTPGFIAMKKMVKSKLY